MKEVEKETKIGRPRKEDRNQDLIKKRVENKERWTLRALGEKYSLHHTTVLEILTRYGIS